MNELATTTGNAVANQSDAYNAFEAFGDSGSAIIGDLIKMDRYGDWTAGQEGRDVNGLKMVVNMASVKHGWTRWSGGKPAEDDLVPVASGMQPAARDTLGYLDESEWEVDEHGKPKDPWQRTVSFSGRSPDDGKEYTYSASSKGAQNAVKALCAQFGRVGLREHPGCLPLVALQSAHYMHPVYKKLFNPVFEILDWVSEGELMGADAEADEADQVETDGEEKPAARSKKTKF